MHTYILILRHKTTAHVFGTLVLAAHAQNYKTISASVFGVLLPMAQTDNHKAFTAHVSGSLVLQRRHATIIQSMRKFCYISRRHKALNAHVFCTFEPTAKEQGMNYTSDILKMLTVLISRLEKTFCYIGSYYAGIEPNTQLYKLTFIVSIRRLITCHLLSG